MDAERSVLKDHEFVDWRAPSNGAKRFRKQMRRRAKRLAREEVVALEYGRRASVAESTGAR